MKLRSLARHWDAFGRRDPFWAVLAQPDKQGGRWTGDEFFATGRAEIDSVMAYLRSLGLHVPARRALDFGSGLGRTTQALADHFDEVVGVDVAPSMIEQARQHNRHGTRCAFLLHQSDDLGLFGEGAFSFVYSNIVLQHIRPRYTRRYVREFLRVLAADGVALFQLPSHPAAGLPRAGRLRRLPEPLWRRWQRLRQAFDFPRMDVYGIPRAEVSALVEHAGGRVIDVVSDTSAGPTWVGYRYCVSRS